MRVPLAQPLEKIAHGGSVRIGRLIARVVFSLSCLLAVAPAGAETMVVHAGRLITDASEPPMGAATITVSEGKITTITDGHLPAPPGVRLVDLSTKTVLPGLVDAHVHLSSEPDDPFWRGAVDSDEWATILGVKNARITAKAGFTTVRDVGSAKLVGFALRRATEAGLIDGPRIVSAGRVLTIIGGHGDVSGFRPEVIEVLEGIGSTCTGAEQCAAKVREASRLGADFIKITATGGVLSQQSRGLGQHFTHSEMAAIVDTARSLGLKVAAHAHGARGVEAAAMVGVDSIEHGTLADAKAITAMKKSGTVLVPTLMAFVGLREGLAKQLFTPEVAAKAREFLKDVGKAGRAARAQGVAIAFGTDAGVYQHGRNAEEFRALVETIGMTPAEAIASATTTAAKLLGLESQIGRIAPGYSADLIAVDGDPLQDVRVLEKVDFVMVRGRTIQ